MLSYEHTRTSLEAAEKTAAPLAIRKPLLIKHVERKTHAVTEIRRIQYLNRVYNNI